MSSQIINTSEQDGKRAVFLATCRLMPFLFLAMVINFMDRINVGYAALKMNADTGISPSMYGVGASIFFVGYMLFEVPSNLAMEKFGARVWLARIMISWGIVSACMSLIVGPQSFYLLRFLLGVTEAGFFPGVILYITYWFPHTHRARVIGMFMVAIPIAGIISAPISVALMSLDGFMGLKGWQNMFIVEGSLAVIMGILAYGYLPDRPTAAKWLSPAQKSGLLKLIGTEPAMPKVTWQTRLKILFFSVDVMLMCLIFFTMLSGLYAISFWLPQIVKGLGLSLREVGMVAAIPFIVACIVMVTWSRISDSRGNRVRHLVGTCVAASLGFLIAAVFSKSPPGVIVGLSIALSGALAGGPIFWAYATSILKAEWSAPSIAIVTTVATLGGVVTPAFIGFVKEISGEFAISLGSLAVIPTLGVIATLWLAARQKRGKEIGAQIEAERHARSIITG